GRCRARLRCTQAMAPPRAFRTSSRRTRSSEEPRPEPRRPSALSDYARLAQNARNPARTKARFDPNARNWCPNLPVLSEREGDTGHVRLQLDRENPRVLLVALAAEDG